MCEYSFVLVWRHTRGGHKSACESQVSRSALWFSGFELRVAGLGAGISPTHVFKFIEVLLYHIISIIENVSSVLKNNHYSVARSIPKCLFKDLLFKIFINLVFMFIMKLTTKISLFITGAISSVQFCQPLLPVF